jgi:transcription antitermination factor NusG
MHRFDSLPDASLGDWYVLHTKSRQEKALAQDLTLQGIGYYLPLLRKTKFYGKRRAEVEEPLFPGYLFLRGSLDQAYVADRTTRVSNIIKVPDQGQMNWQLTNLSLALSRSAPLDPYPYLKEGVRVEVKAGSFRGLQGMVERRSGWERLILQVDLLGRAMSLELHGAMVEPLE